ncbi:hypothetical protein UFOVP435_46 [uncultured Caudovirales phage]|uniref:Uncharacterized protein n=1 Tax=uncultured Caudovirales phage TaxID=2100421 RepID=A0A6J5M8M5_9CAUD|nr:hypothetical protein UFOVP435_46 [uncultured Caudovirales phage]
MYTAIEWRRAVWGEPLTPTGGRVLCTPSVVTLLVPQVLCSKFLILITLISFVTLVTVVTYLCACIHGQNLYHHSLKSSVTSYKCY